MRQEMERMIFNLSEELQYSLKGEFVKTATLEFTPPSSKSFGEALDLSQMVMGAMMDSRDILTNKDTVETATADGESEDIDADSVRALLMASQKVKMSIVMEKFNELALKCGTFDGTVRITNTTLGKLSLPEYTRLLCEYIANFIIPSLV